MTRLKLFEAIRPYAPGQRFTPAMVTMIDALADRFGLSRLEGVALDWMPYALDLIKEFEGCVLDAYPDPGSGGDPWTIGWGSTGSGIAKGISWTQEQADARLGEHVLEFAEGVRDAVGGSATKPWQMGAMVSLAYNIGVGNFKASTLAKMHKAGDYAGAALQFPRWNRSSGKVMNGLTRRRAAEAKVYKGES